MTDFILKLKSSNHILWNSGIFFFVMAIITSLGFVIDERKILGINPWVKPIKFDISIGIFLITMAWVLQYLPSSKSQAIDKYFVLFMAIEIICIKFQAFRGEISHFNITSPLGGFLFGFMGIAILLNTLLIVYVWWLLGNFRPEIPEVYLLSIRLGLITLVLGSSIGWIMVAKMSHTIGVADGGVGLPFLNWSREAGDLRISHFIGIHGIQILIFSGYLLAFSNTFSGLKQFETWIIYIVFILVMTMTSLALIQALSGKPLV